MKHPVIYLLLFAALLFTGSPAKAEILHVVTIDLAPYGYSRDGQHAGLCYEIGAALAEAAGMNMDNRMVSLLSGVEELNHGHADLVIMIPNERIDAVAHNLGPVFPVELVALGRRDTVFRSPDDVRGKTVGSIHGAKHIELGKRYSMVFYPTVSYDQSLKLLLAKRVDAVLGPKLSLDFLARFNRIPPQALNTPIVLSTDDACVMASRSLPEGKLNRLRQALNLIKSNGTLKSIVVRYSL